MATKGLMVTWASLVRALAGLAGYDGRMPPVPERQLGRERLFSVRAE